MMKLGLLVLVIASTCFIVATTFELLLLYTLICLMPLLGGLGLVTVNNEAILLIKFEKQSGTISAVLGVLKFGAGSLAGPIWATFYDYSALPFSSLLLISLIMIAVIQWPLLFSKEPK